MASIGLECANFPAVAYRGLLATTLVSSPPFAAWIMALALARCRQRYPPDWEHLHEIAS